VQRLVARRDHGARLETDGRGHDGGRDFLADVQRLRRGQRCAPYVTRGITHELDGNQARELLEHQRRCERPPLALREERKRERRSDVRVPGERDLARAGEDANLRGVRRIIGRQYERRLRIVELGGDRLHLRPRQTPRVRHDRDRVAHERAVREHVDRDVAVCRRHRRVSELSAR
jgi:hypothetical protein